MCGLKENATGLSSLGNLSDGDGMPIGEATTSNRARGFSLFYGQSAKVNNSDRPLPSQPGSPFQITKGSPDEGLSGKDAQRLASITYWCPHCIVTRF